MLQYHYWKVRSHVVYTLGYVDILSLNPNLVGVET